MRHDIGKSSPWCQQICHDVKKYVMTSKNRHDVKKFVNVKNNHNVKVFAMTSQMRHDVKNTSWRQKVDNENDVKKFVKTSKR